MTMTDTTDMQRLRHTDIQQLRRDGTRPRVLHAVHLRELTMPDGRKLLLDRRSIAFVCQAKPEEFGGKQVCIISFKAWAKPIPVVDGYYELKTWGVATMQRQGRVSMVESRTIE